jgi:hypothetical protein
MILSISIFSLFLEPKNIANQVKIGTSEARKKKKLFNPYIPSLLVTSPYLKEKIYRNNPTNLH